MAAPNYAALKAAMATGGNAAVQANYTLLVTPTLSV